METRKDPLARLLRVTLDILIVLAVALVFAEEAAAGMGAAWTLRRILALASAAFDLFFAAEFSARLALAVSDGEAGLYLVEKGGWLDGRRFEIHFPKRFTLALKLVSLLPYRWYFPLIRRITGA